jgi:hypothetical protein
MSFGNILNAANSPRYTVQSFVLFFLSVLMMSSLIQLRESAAKDKEIVVIL